jgi:hypothetical protein
VTAAPSARFHGALRGSSATFGSGAAATRITTGVSQTATLSDNGIDFTGPRHS